ncbi:MAG: helix-turn-helix domain-containing protein [Bacteroidaceae bacterium]|nr:helix-turn-helix domain-containing protein [Bacteroidaceae bacterium]
MIILLFPLHASGVMAENPTCPLVKVELERLPDLNVPRSGHSLLCIGGEMVVFGGHTSGFVPTPTAEYYKDGKWHLMQMTYTHDNGFALALKSGKVLLGGGAEKPHGIGQTYGVEYYHPDTHSFEGFTILDQKRALASALEIDSGKVVVSGNWYADDAIEIFDGERTFTRLKAVNSQRSSPIICRISADDAILFSKLDTYGKEFDYIVIDRLKGDPFTAPLFDDWAPINWEFSSNEPGFIGDEETGVYTYLLALKNRHDGSFGIAKVEGTEFSLLTTASPIPTEAGYGRIQYFGYLMADRQAQRCYVLGVDDDRRLYALAVDYSQSPAPLTLYHTDPLESRMDPYMPALTPEGDIMLAGGISGDNFSPFSTVYLIHVGSKATLTSQSMALSRWVLGLLALLIIALFVALWLYRRNKTVKHEEDITASPKDNAAETLMNSIHEVMLKEQLFRESELKVADVAQRLNVNVKDVAECIKANRGVTFVQFVNGYRVDYAKQLLRQNPDIKIAALCLESGFASERSFFRIFKTFTGMTAQEWMNQKD